MTLGLSHHVLPLPDEKLVRQELMFCAHDPEPIANWLTTMADYVITRHEAVPKFVPIHLTRPRLPGTSMDTLLAYGPSLFPDSFAVFEGSDPPTVLVWLIALHGDEADYVRTNGVHAFEHLLEDVAPDLLDLGRASILRNGGP